MARRSLTLTLVLLAALLAASPAHAAKGGTVRGSGTVRVGGAVRGGGVARKKAEKDPLGSRTDGSTEAPIPVAPSDTTLPGRRLSSDRVLAIAAALASMKRLRAHHPDAYAGAYLKGAGRWQVSYFSKGGQEIGQVIVLDLTGRAIEQWTGFQVAWSMARGNPGAFGRHVDALYVWLPLCLLFLAPFFDWRKPLSLAHLDLLALLSFSVSLAFFNHADIGLSTPLAYPPLIYLLARMTWLALRRGRVASAPRLVIPVPWLAVGVVFLVAFRIVLNVTDSNVIDVGYAGVIGAERIQHGKRLYGGYPSDNEHGDTYGPVNYEAYIPFELLFGWSGRWDDLPAAHAAAIVFDLLAIALLFLLGRRVRGPGLGIVLAYGWVSYPFTLFALESNSNDALVGALALAAVLASCSPRARGAPDACAPTARGGSAAFWVPARGALTALAGLTKFAPLALTPLLATHGLHGLSPGRRARRVAGFSLAFLLAGALALVPALTHDSLATIWRRSVSYQAGRESPLSIWGFYGNLDWLEHVVQGVTVVLAVVLALVPRRRDPVGLAAAAAAVLIALQLGASHWFYLYVPWFFGLAIVALFEGVSPRLPQGGASSPARSTLPAASASSAPGPPSARGPLLRSRSAPASV